MDKYLIITGSSRGIGNATAKLFLENGYFVHGIGRSKTISHPHYCHHQLDLSVGQSVQKMNWPKVGDEDEVILINNAATIGEIGYVGSLDENDAARTIQVNYTSPIQLMNAFKAKYKGGTIINISSGAGKRPVDGWSLYCSTKAALDMFAQTFKKETKQTGLPFRIFNVSPGVVDTEMQVHIRNQNAKDFSRVEEFKMMKEKSELRPPSFVAEKLYALVQNGKFDDDLIVELSR